MKPKNKWMNLVVIVSIAIVMGLAGCSDSSQAPIATTIPTSTSASSPEAASATATPDVINGSASPTAADGSRIDPSATVDRATCAKLNLNEATEADLMATIPGFSSRMVREFLEYRPYASIQEFRREIGKYVDAAQVAEYETFVYVPVDPNASDAETLKQLPGVDDAIATTLISGRLYASNQAFVGALAAWVDEQQPLQAGCYLVAK